MDRTSCPWLIRKFIDPDAEFVFVRHGTNAATQNGYTLDMRGGDYTHKDGRSTFLVMLERRGLQRDPALAEMGRIISDADVPPSRTRRPEAAGLDALIRGVQLSVPDDHETLRLTAPLYDALYAYCQAEVSQPKIRQGTPRPRLKYTRRVMQHLDEDA